MLSVMMSALGGRKRSDGELIAEAIGTFKYLYYNFLERFHREPRDLDDYIDGVIYIELNNHFKNARTE
jgi:hypothetical protein